MKKSRILLFTFLLVLHTGCMDINKRQVQSGPLSYDQAIELAKQYLREGGYYKENETVFWYDPKCSFWFMRYSNRPDALAGASKEFGLTRNYYAIFFAGENRGQSPISGSIIGDCP
jgi:hypothetical protein